MSEPSSGKGQIMSEYWFKSTLFDIEPGEDEETNPQCYGKQLSSWLKDELSDLGYDVEDVIPEDWGWCVMCSREPYWLWVGCGCLVEETDSDAQEVIPNKDKIVWHCFVEAEVPFFKSIFKKADTTEGVRKLASDLESLLKSRTEITLLEAS
jgi:hypothetical protein